MQPVLDHITAVVRPALRKYMAAERALDGALQSGDLGVAEIARQDVRLAARQAAEVLHHLSDFVSKEPPAEFSSSLEEVRRAVGGNCFYSRTGQPVADVDLLRDVADAFKHHRLDRKGAKVAVSSAIVPIGTGYSVVPYGEGKFGGSEQVIIVMNDDKIRVLSSVLQNVFDAWMTLLGQPQGPMGDY